MKLLRYFSIVYFMLGFISCQLFYPEFFVTEVIEHRGDTNWKLDTNYWQMLGGARATTTAVSSLVMDVSESGILYLAYTDDETSVKVMKYINSNWMSVGYGQVSDGGALFLDFVIDNETPYVAYQDISNDLKATVKKWNGSVWETIGTEGFTEREAQSISLTVSSGIPYIAFGDRGRVFGLNVMTYTGGTWQELGDSSNLTSLAATYISAQTDGAELYVVYQDMYNLNAASGVKYSGTWERLGFEGFTESTADYTVLKIDNHTPYIAFRDGAHGNKASVMKYNGFLWENFGTPGFTQGIANDINFEIKNGYYYVGFQDGEENLKASVMIRSNNIWTNVGNPGLSIGIANSISMCVYDNIVYVAYIDASDEGGNCITVMKF